MGTQSNKNAKNSLKRGKARESAGKRGEARVTKSWLVLFLRLIGRESGTSFQDQLLGRSKKLKQNWSHPGLFSKLNSNWSITIKGRRSHKNLFSRDNSHTA